MAEKKNKIKPKPITFRPTKENEWLCDALEQERIKQMRPSINNMMAYILMEYFNKKKKRS